MTLSKRSQIAGCVLSASSSWAARFCDPTETPMTLASPSTPPTSSCKCNTKFSELAEDRSSKFACPSSKRKMTSEVFFDLSCCGIARVARIQDGDRSMTGYVPVDPAMHRHQSNIHLLLGARCKKRVDDSVRRHFARSDEEKSRRPLLEE